MLTMWAFIGVESASIPADDVENPKRTIPLGTILGTLSTLAIYVLTTAAVVSILTLEKTQKACAPFSDAAEILFGPILEPLGIPAMAGSIIAIAAILSSYGSLNGWILNQAMVSYAAARDGLFPKPFARVSKKGVPLLGLTITSALMSIVYLVVSSYSLGDQFEILISVATLLALIVYLLCVFADLVMSKRKGGEFKLSFWQLVISGIALLYVLGAMFGGTRELIMTCQGTLT